MYTINAGSGALTSKGTIPAGLSPISIAIDPSGKFAYVANFDSHNVSMYRIDAATGALTLIGTIGT
jgi:6-phosphogluconolactonase (cycloisomerase 2 family)